MREDYNGISATSENQARMYNKWFKPKTTFPLDPNAPKEGDRSTAVVDPNAPKPKEVKKSAGKVAPHENNELRLILEGKKPLATFEHGKSHKKYRQQLEKLTPVDRLKLFAIEGAQGLTIVTLKANSGLAEVYATAYNNWNDGHIQDESWHRLAGQLLGYSEADIEAFLNSEIRKTCYCSQCRAAGKLRK